MPGRFGPETIRNIWDLIASGSLEAGLARDRRPISGMRLERDVFYLDIEDAGRTAGLLRQILKLAISLRSMISTQLLQMGKEDGGNAIKATISMPSRIGETLDSWGKTVVVRYRSKKVLILGKEARRSVLRLIGVKHIGLPHKFELLKLGVRFLPLLKELNELRKADSKARSQVATILS